MIENQVPVFVSLYPPSYRQGAEQTKVIYQVAEILTYAFLNDISFTTKE
jgi:hypothetical protein